MQNSILMKDTQLFLTEGCLTWLFLFICPSDISPANEDGGLFEEWPQPVKKRVAGSGSRLTPTPATPQNEEKTMKQKCTRGCYSVELLHNALCWGTQHSVCSKVERQGREREMNHSKTLASSEL